jgi:hypothetical protein
MNKFLLPTLAIVAFVAPSSQAQNISRLDRSFDVNGVLQTPEGRRDIRTISVDLNANGTATLRLSGRGNNFWNNISSDLTFSGRWSGNKRQVTIDLDRASGRNIFGTATLRFDSDFDNSRNDRPGSWGGALRRNDRKRPLLEQISISGRLENNRGNSQTYKGVFDIQDNQGDDYRGGINDLFANKQGSGTVRINGGRAENIRSAKVDLARDGDAKITVQGNQTWTFEGSWRQISRDRIALRLDGTSTSKSTRRSPDDDGLGNGEIILEGSSFESLNLAGRRGNQGFEVDFSASGRGNNQKDNTLIDRKLGRGSYKSERGQRKLTAIDIRLQANGVAKVSFAGDGKEFSLEGRWSRNRNGDYIATLEGGERDDMNGVATITVEGGKLKNFDFVGRDRSGRCTITFSS